MLADLHRQGSPRVFRTGHAGRPKEAPAIASLSFPGVLCRSAQASACVRKTPYHVEPDQHTTTCPTAESGSNRHHAWWRNKAGNHDHDNRMGLGGQHGRPGLPLVVQTRTNFLARLARIDAGRRTPAARAAHPLRGDTHALTGRFAPVVGLGAQGAYAVGRLLHGLQCSAGGDAIFARGEGIGFGGVEFGGKVVPGPVGRRSVPGRRFLRFVGGGRGRGRGRLCLGGWRDGRRHGRTRRRRGAATPRGQDAGAHRRCGPLRANHGTHDSTRMSGWDKHVRGEGPACPWWCQTARPCGPGAPLRRRRWSPEAARSCLVQATPGFAQGPCAEAPCDRTGRTG